MKEWQTFVRRFSDMREGRRELFIKALAEGPTKYDTRHVVAIVSREKVPGADLLWLRAESGQRADEPLYIKVEKELEPWVAGAPWDDLLGILRKREEAG